MLELKNQIGTFLEENPNEDANLFSNENFILLGRNLVASQSLEITGLGDISLDEMCSFSGTWLLSGCGCLQREETYWAAKKDNLFQLITLI